MTDATEFVNKHGRKPGRGIRPWLLMPKIIALSAAFGGLLSAAMLVHVAGDSDMPQDQAVRLATHVRVIFRYVIVPAACLAVLFGVLLLLQHPRVFLSRRWMQVKLAALVVVVPITHFLGRGAMIEAFRQIDAGASPLPMLQRLAYTIDFALVAILLVYILGRQKPRLGQNIAKTRSSAAPV